MTHSDLDPIIYPWAKKFGLFILTSCRDDEIRAIDVVDDSGYIYKISISPSFDEEDVVIVDVWDGQKESANYQASLSSLDSCLDKGYSKISEWITSRGHSRTPVL